MPPPNDKENIKMQENIVESNRYIGENRKLDTLDHKEKWANDVLSSSYIR